MSGIIDVHSHLLPGVDDGAESFNASFKLLRAEYEQGVRSVILTPHYRKDYFEADRAIVKERFCELGDRMASVGIQMQIYLGCEFHRENEMMSFICSDAAYTMAGTRYVLVEFSGSDDESCFTRYVREMVICGYRPIIAHVERYPDMRNLQRIEHLIRRGAYIQVNAGSILGREGMRQKGFSRKLLKEGFVHLIGSDAHDLRRRTPCMGECEKYLIKKIGKGNTQRLMLENPGRLLADEKI